MKRLGIPLALPALGAICCFLGGGLVACSSEQPRNPSQQAAANSATQDQQGQQAQQQAQEQQQPGQAAVESPSAQAPGMEETAAGYASPRDKLGVVSEAPTTSRIPTEKTVIRGQRIPTITETRVGADINRMSAGDFKALGLSGDLSQSIVQFRDAHGPFKSVKDLGRVPHMDMGWLADNSDRLAVAGRGAPTG